MAEPEPSQPKVRMIKSTLTIDFVTEPQGGHPRLTGKVRPAVPREIRVFAESLANAKNAGEKSDLMTQFYSEHLKIWDLVDEDDHTLPVTPETVAGVPDPVYAQFDNIVCGYRALILKNSEPSSVS